MNSKLETVEIAVSDLVPYAGNAKKHPEWQIDQIVQSIKEFGFNDPIGAWHDSEGRPVIVEGHGRVLAAKELGIEKIPVVFLDHLDDDARRAYTHIHNKLNMNTGFDSEKLAEELNSLTFNWDEFGFDEFELAELATSANDFNPNTEEIARYSEEGENSLVSYNVIICCLDDEEQDWLKGLLKEDDRLKRMYMASEIKARFDA